MADGDDAGMAELDDAGVDKLADAAEDQLSSTVLTMRFFKRGKED